MTATPENKTIGIYPQALQTKLATEERGALKILVAEDNFVNQKFISTLLRHKGWGISIANNGKEAVSLYSEGGFDVILMDVGMPEMDGIQATKMIRECEKATGGHIPIIAVTAHAMKGDQERFLAEGMDGYVTKPINRKILYEMIDSLVARK